MKPRSGPSTRSWRPAALLVVLGAVGVLGGAGCGDNSKVCGPGTGDSDGDGVCEPTGAGGGVRCGEGTVLDPVTGDRCVPGPGVCGEGTVLVHGTCQDPTVDLAIDLEEGPEPNGDEVGAIPAGEITLEPVGGDGFVIRGCIVPLGDTAPDLDSYLLTVTAPTLLAITADGVHGLAAGFVVTSTATTGPLAGFERYGLGLATDVARRQVYLPAAGTYRVVLADTRTLLPRIDGAGGAVSPPAGNPDGTSCYFVTIDQQTPVPVALDLAAGDTSTIGEDLKFFTTSGLAGGVTTVTTTIGSPHAQPAVMIVNGDAVQIDDDGSAVVDATSGDAPMIVGDFVYNVALFPASYRLVVTRSP
ncbi:MAG: hypothetical protein M3680_20425 [Myxococcota bacterium]|nr:hypothetical protein [Myxococcota bacterium]